MIVSIGLISLSLFNVSLADNQSELNRKVDKLFNEEIEPDGPGCAVAIYQNNKMLYSQGYGLADIENNVAITPKSAFNIGSTSKQFTAASIIKLEQQGRLSLKDDIRKYLPEIPQYERKITIRHLLNHTSGLRDYIDLMLLSGFDIDDVTTDFDALDLIKRQNSLNFEPGSEYLYSNTGYFLASLIVERVSGKTLKQFAHDNIFQPLSMTSSSYVNSHKTIVKNRATGYRKDKDGNYSLDVSYWEQNGDGGVFTTVEDLLHWNSVFFSDSLENTKLKNSLYQRGQLNDGRENKYALGLIHAQHKGTERVYHSGSWAGYRSNLARIPAHNLAVSVLCNTAHVHPVHMTEMTFQIYLSKPLKESNIQKVENRTERIRYNPVKIPETIYQELAGKYEFIEYPNEFIELSYSDGVFTLVDYDEKVSLKAASETLFINEEGDPRIEFEYDEAEALDKVTMYGSKSGESYPLKKWTPYIAEKTELESIVGLYRSDELNLDLQIEYLDGGLLATDRHGRAFSLMFLDKNRMLADNEEFSLLDVQRGSNDIFKGFSVSTKGSLNITFLKK